jgi:hypothetical protein
MRWRLRGRRGSDDGGSTELDARLAESWEAAAAAVGKMLDIPAGKKALLASSGLTQEETAGLRAPAGMTRRAARRRRRLLLRSAAAAAALTAVAVVLAAIGVPGAGHTGAEGTTVSTAYVVKRVDGALSAADPGAIAKMTVTTRSAATSGDQAAATTAEEWSYGDRWRAVTYSAAGHLLYDEGFSISSVYTVVSYQARTWARQHGLGHPAKVAPGPRGCGPGVAALPMLFRPGLPGPGGFTHSPATVARALHAAVSCGTLEEVGRQQVDGIEAIKLTSSPDSQIPETIWVSPGTYLPVRVVLRPALGQPGPWQAADITWLPPTAQNLATLTVPIPVGYRQVPLAQAVPPVMRPIPVGTKP